MTEETQYDVFLSHNSIDEPTVWKPSPSPGWKPASPPWLDTWNLVSCALARDR
jgi:hypothetical protein